MRYEAGAILALALAACKPVSSAEQTALDARAVEGEARAKTTDENFRRALTSLPPLATAKLGDAKCTVPLYPRDLRAFAQDLGRFSVSRVALGGGRGVRFRSEGVAIVDEVSATLTSSAADALRRSLERFQKHDDLALKKTKGAALLADADATLRAAPNDLVIVVQAAVDAQAKDDKTFAKGAIIGRAYLIDGGRGVVVCAGEVAAQSSNSVSSLKLGGTAMAQGAVDVDLYRNLITQAEESLRALP